MALLSNQIIVTPLFFLFLCFIPSSYSIPTITISETSNQTLVCALVQPYNNSAQGVQPRLNCTSFHSGARIPVNQEISFQGVVSGDGFLCALRTFPSSSTSSILCWRFSADGTITSHKRIYQGPSLSELEAGDSHICGLVNDTNRARLACWQWPEIDYKSITQNFTSLAVGGDFVCGLFSEQGTISCHGNTNQILANSPSNGGYVKISAGNSHACALSSDNNLTCWGSSAGAVPPPGEKFLSMALGFNRSCGLRTNWTVVCWGENNFSLPEILRQEHFITIAAKRNVFCGVKKEDYSLHCWNNTSLDPNTPDLDSVQPGPCTNTSLCRCGPVAGSGRFCSGGSSICEDCPAESTQPAVPPRPSVPTGGRSSEWNGRMIAFMVVGCVGSVGFMFTVGFFFFGYCKSSAVSRVHDSGPLDESQAPTPAQPATGSRQERASQAAEASQTPVLEKRLSQLASLGNVGRLEDFPLEVLSQATKNFSEDCMIGSGSYGSVYHGKLEDGREVAIKRAEASSGASYAVIGTRRQEDKDDAFVNELESLSRIHHKNLVPLLGFCEDSNERILVYEYMANGTLHDHLHDLDYSSPSPSCSASTSASPLSSWPQRIKVALDAARGIEYLHKYAVPPIIHRDIKTSNILLDSEWTAKVSDFGLSLMGPQDDESHLSLRAAGTMGYMDPEYYRLQVLTTKSDVYSFGVVLLELLSGYKAIHKNENGVPRNVVDFVVPYIYQNEIHRVLDRRVPPPTPFEIDAVSYVGFLAADCVAFEGRDRPSMSEIVDSLQRALAACLVHSMTFSRSTTGSSG